MTTLTVRNPVRSGLFNNFDSMFDDFFNADFPLRPYMTMPNRRTANVVNNDEDWQIVFAIPGVDPKEVDIKVDDFTLTVGYNDSSADSRFSFVSSFTRSWTIDRDVSLDDIAANFKNGILTITVPKPENKKRVVKHIEVKAD